MKVTADAGLHSGENVEAIEKSGVDAYIADPQHRKRDELFENQGRYKERHNKEGRRIYSLRLGTVEPVFAKMRGKGMTRFTLRGKKKVDMQWKLCTLVHNIEKIGRHGKLAA